MKKLGDFFRKRMKVKVLRICRKKRMLLRLQHRGLGCSSVVEWVLLVQGSGFDS